ncbi:MAG TPA: hypothetical protein VGP58_14505, partial [Pyrinomonadaceae bacterium]|nr:hypothetical protein [Pyrinomonadaceae bacterium]
NQTEAEALARASKIEFENYADLTRDERIFQSVKDTIELANARVSSSEQIKRFIILERDFQSESGEVTPTLKLKRNVVAKNFSKIIEKLYGEM